MCYMIALRMAPAGCSLRMDRARMALACICILCFSTHSACVRSELSLYMYVCIHALQGWFLRVSTFCAFQCILHVSGLNCLCTCMYVCMYVCVYDIARMAPVCIYIMCCFLHTESMCVCINVCMIDTCIHVHARTSLTCAFQCILHVSGQNCPCIYMYVCMYVCVYHTHTNMHACINTCIQTQHTYIHTYIHTY
jgi:hypothetical protein